MSPPPASESRTRPRLIVLTAPPWLLAPSSPPWPVSPPAPPGSLIPLARQLSATSGLHSSGYTLSLWLCQAPSSLCLHLGSLSLQLHHALADPHLRHGCRHHMLRLGPSDHPHHPGSVAPRLCLGLRLGLNHHLLCRRQSSVPPFVYLVPTCVSCLPILSFTLKDYLHSSSFCMYLTVT